MFPFAAMDRLYMINGLGGSALRSLRAKLEEDFKPSPYRVASQAAFAAACPNMDILNNR
jgi:hypothetical protein